MVSKDVGRPGWKERGSWDGKQMAKVHCLSGSDGTLRSRVENFVG